MYSKDVGRQVERFERGEHMKKYLVTFTMHLNKPIMEETGFIAFNCHENAKEIYDVLCAHALITDCFLSEVEED